MLDWYEVGFAIDSHAELGDLGQLEGHLRHAAHGHAVTSGREQQQALLQVHIPAQHHVPEQSETPCMYAKTIVANQ